MGCIGDDRTGENGAGGRANPLKQSCGQKKADGWGQCCHGATHGRQSSADNQQTPPPPQVRERSYEVLANTKTKHK